MTEDIDCKIIKLIENEYRSVKQISEELDESRTRIHVRLRSMRRRGLVTFVLSKNKGMKGVKPLKYKKSIKA